MGPAGWAEEHAGAIGHVHLADHPGLHEPGTGRVDMPALLDALRRRGYGGAVGFEYVPTRPGAEAMGFLADLRALLEHPHAR